MSPSLPWPEIASGWFVLASNDRIALFALLVLVAIFAGIFWWGRRVRARVQKFYLEMGKAGYVTAVALPPALLPDYSWLSARSGSPPQQGAEILLLFGTRKGTIVPVGASGLVQTWDAFLGFFLPKSRALSADATRALRKAKSRFFAADTLKDGSQIFLWVRTYTPKHLAEILSLLPKSEATKPAPAPGSPSSQRLKPFYFAGIFSDGAGTSCFVYDRYQRETMMNEGELMAAFMDQAKAAFAAKGKPDATPVSLTINNHYELYAKPVPPPEDKRPLKCWQVDAEIVVHDVKFSTHVSGTLDWPEEPKGNALERMVHYLAAEATTMRGDGPEFADYAEISAVIVKLKTAGA